MKMINKDAQMKRINKNARDEKDNKDAQMKRINMV